MGIVTARIRALVRAAGAGAGASISTGRRGSRGGRGRSRSRQVATRIAEIRVPRMEERPVGWVGTFRVAGAIGRRVFQASQQSRLAETRDVGLPVALIRGTATLGLLEHIAAGPAAGKLARARAGNELRILCRCHHGRENGRENETRDEMIEKAADTATG